MSDITIYHNPRCSKSRQALEILKKLVDEHSLSLYVIEYLKHPPSFDEIKEIFKKTGLEHAIDMIRPKEAEFKTALLTKSSSNDQILEAITHYPKLLERPLITYQNNAIIARPPELVEKLFND